MKNKETQIAFTHKVDARHKNIVLVSTVGEVGAVTAVTYRGQNLTTLSKMRGWQWQWKFPFLVRREMSIYYTFVKPNK